VRNSAKCIRKIAVINKAVREGLINKVVFEKKPKIRIEGR
jgi:hypothetical protein